MVLKVRTHLDFEALNPILWRDVILIRFLVRNTTYMIMIGWVRDEFMARSFFVRIIGVDSFYEIIIRDAFESFLYSTYDYEKGYD